MPTIGRINFKWWAIVRNVVKGQKIVHFSKRTVVYDIFALFFEGNNSILFFEENNSLNSW